MACAATVGCGAVIALGTEWVPAAAVAGVGWLAGWLLLRAVAAFDRAGWLAARAPALPIARVSTHDDAWIRGRVECDAPLSCPWFEIACVRYEYAQERLVTRTRRDQRGRVHTESSWEVERTERDSVPFRLRDQDGVIEVAGREASFEDLESTGIDYESTRLRHRARVLPVGAEVSALGVERDDDTFGPLRDVPLLVTPRTRTEYLRSSDRAERWLRRFAYTLPLLAGTGAMLLLRGEPQRPVDWAIAGGTGALLLLPVWGIATWNRLVAQRHQVEAAWRQIDVDLEVRDQLLPQLAEVVRGYAAHEQELLAGLASARAGDQAARAVGATLVALREKHPELEADALFEDLAGRIWALEEKLAISRTLYDRVVTEWNDLVGGLPTAILAWLAGARRRPTFAERAVE